MSSSSSRQQAKKFSLTHGRSSRGEEDLRSLRVEVSVGEVMLPNESVSTKSRPNVNNSTSRKCGHRSDGVRDE